MTQRPETTVERARRVIRQEGSPALARAVLRKFRKPTSLLSVDAQRSVDIGVAKVRMRAAESVGRVARIRTRDFGKYDQELAEILAVTTSTGFRPRNIEHVTDSSAYPDWDLSLKAFRQRDRLGRVADLCARRYPGDFIEIGAYRGLTTARLAEVAREHGRRVIVVDPWATEIELDDGLTYNIDYEAFMKTVEPVIDTLDIVRASSLDATTMSLVAQRQLAFAYVDGLHTFDAALSDIRMVQHAAGVIAVDDTHWIADHQFGGHVRRATARAARLIDRVAVHHPEIRETYLLPPPVRG